MSFEEFDLAAERLKRLVCEGVDALFDRLAASYGIYPPSIALQEPSPRQPTSPEPQIPLQEPSSPSEAQPDLNSANHDQCSPQAESALDEDDNHFEVGSPYSQADSHDGDDPTCMCGACLSDLMRQEMAQNTEYCSNDSPNAAPSSPTNAVQSASQTPDQSASSPAITSSHTEQFEEVQSPEFIEHCTQSPDIHQIETSSIDCTPLTDNEVQTPDLATSDILSSEEEPPVERHSIQPPELASSDLYSPDSIVLPRPKHNKSCVAKEQSVPVKTCKHGKPLHKKTNKSQDAAKKRHSSNESTGPAIKKQRPSEPSIAPSTPILQSPLLNLPKPKATEEDMYYSLIYNCTYPACRSSFDTETRMNSHLKSEHDMLQFACPFRECPKVSFDFMHELVGHFMDNHKSDAGHKCHRCGKRFPKCIELYRHCQREHQRGTFRCSCPGCQFNAPTRMEVISHYTAKHSIMYTTINLKCYSCNDWFNSKSALFAHMKERHSMYEFTCPLSECGRSFDKRSELMKHANSYHSNVDQWLCKKCDSRNVYRRIDLLYEHEHYRHHEGRFKCTVEGCGYFGKVRIDSLTHYDLEHCAKYCNRCHVWFDSTSLFQRHNCSVDAEKRTAKRHLS